MDLDSFFPFKDRFALAMKLNNLLAAPGFSAWLEGEALDVATLLYSPSGKPRLSIVSIAHLNDAERMFFVTLLLTQVVGWMRAQSGTASLRAILYMDEIFGYFPPVANPPSKAPLLTLLKQARAFGLGVVMATQNPVDLDYKGLANTGTWFIGRLQTERDKARVLEGLEGAAASGGRGFDRSRMERLLAGLGSRVFLMNNVHEDTPEIFQTRWTLSYLAGPLTRAQIKRLMEPVQPQASDPPPAAPPSAADRQTSTKHMPDDTPDASMSRPVLPPEVPQYFIPVRGAQPAGARLLYRPMLLGFAHVRFVNTKAGVDQIEPVTMLAPITDGPVPIAWDRAGEAALEIADLNDGPEEGAAFAPLPTHAGKEKSYERWKQDFSGWLYRTRKIELMRSPGTNLLSRPAESEREFRVRLQQAGREQRDQEAERLRLKYATKITTLQERIRKAQQTVERQTAESRHSQLQAALSVGATILGAFLGRKTVSAANIGKATTAIRSAGRVMKEAKDVGQAEENVAALEQQLADLEKQFHQEIEKAAAATDPVTESFEAISITPTKSNIAVKLVALAWMPQWQTADGALTPAWQ
jgi:DNA-binding ferritin-like protein